MLQGATSQSRRYNRVDTSLPDMFRRNYQIVRRFSLGQTMYEKFRPGGSATRKAPLSSMERVIDVKIRFSQNSCWLVGNGCGTKVRRSLVSGFQIYSLPLLSDTTSALAMWDDLSFSIPDDFMKLDFICRLAHNQGTIHEIDHHRAYYSDLNLQEIREDHLLELNKRGHHHMPSLVSS